VNAVEDHHAAEDRVQRRHEEIAPVGQTFGLDDLDGFAINRQRLLVEGLRDDDVGQGLRTVLLELGSPGRELLLDIAVDGSNQPWRQSPCIRKRGGFGPRPEIVRSSG
jgi:hypothetical protein